MENQEKELLRECEAILIPSGEKVTLPPGGRVYIQQVLGGSYTVMTGFGLARISGDDADALGEETKAPEPTPAADNTDPGAPPEEQQIWNALKNVYDPEIPVNIVDLGLVYDCQLGPAQEGKGARADVKMTLTAPGCGMGPAIASDAESKIKGVPGMTEAKVDIVWDPPWNQDMISEEGKMVLGLI
ncbi:MAG: putative Fe-S cluster assembly protein SufT [Opitutales bacterium]|nr:putative Fe-S cluster assembly protein SufT [Opitutales bacterium]